jgi:tetratricopeptide (TPR) repeat protein
MAVSMEEIRFKAASAVFALANRTASKGRVDEGKKRKAHWIESSWGRLIDPEKFREAIAYYEIAASIDSGPNGAFATYTKALLLEELSDFPEAEKCFLSLAGTTYAAFGATGAERCREKAAGTYDARGEALAALQSAAEKVSAAGAETGPQDAEELASAAALGFVNLLLDKKYSAAKAMLHSSLSDVSAQDLKRSFEELFEDQAFPESANAFDALLEWPHKQEQDLALIYVSIDGDSSEAVTALVARENDKLTIREIDWGSP